MNSLEKLTELCNKQGRAIYTSSFNNRSSIVITYPETYEEVEKEMGGSNSLNYYASLLLDNMKKDIILRVVK